MMFNYFFGSDTRSLGFLEIVNKKESVIIDSMDDKSPSDDALLNDLEKRLLQEIGDGT